MEGNQECAEAYKQYLYRTIHSTKVHEAYDPVLASVQENIRSSILRGYSQGNSVRFKTAAASRLKAPYEQQRDGMVAERDALLAKLKYEQEKIRYEYAECFQ